MAAPPPRWIYSLEFAAQPLEQIDQLGEIIDGFCGRHGFAWTELEFSHLIVMTDERWGADGRPAGTVVAILLLKEKQITLLLVSKQERRRGSATALVNKAASICGGGLQVVFQPGIYPDGVPFFKSVGFMIKREGTKEILMGTPDASWKDPKMREQMAFLYEATDAERELYKAQHYAVTPP